jgi:hypothetical protein
MYGYYRNYGCRLLEFEILGYRALTLENEILRTTVLADKGTCIYELLHKPSDTDFLWRFERGLRPKGYVESIPHPKGSFQDYLAGGWDEMFPIFGPATPVGGLPIGYHGEVACVPWEYVIEQDDPEEVAVRFSVRTVRAPFRLAKTLRLRRHCPTLFISETATNEAGVEVAFAWGQHPTFGPPFLSADCVIDAGARRVLAYGREAHERGRLASEDREGNWPHIVGRDSRQVDLRSVPGPDSRVCDHFYLTDFGDPAWCAAMNLDTGVGIGLTWTREVMPSAIVWQESGGNDDAPWWGRTYAMAVEPLSSHPMEFPKALQEGTALRLGPGDSLSLQMTATIFTGGQGVRTIAADGTVELIS